MTAVDLCEIGWDTSGTDTPRDHDSGNSRQRYPHGSANDQDGRCRQLDKGRLTMQRTSNATASLFLILTLACGITAFAQDWPQWRGPNRDAKATGFHAPASWPKTLTKKWQV